MDFSDLKEAFDASRAALGLVKDVKDVMPQGPQRDAVVTSLEQAERASELAEAEIATTLGYPLCRCTFPPQIMLSIGAEIGEDGLSHETFSCPNCDITETRWAADIAVWRDPAFSYVTSPNVSISAI